MLCSGLGWGLLVNATATWPAACVQLQAGLPATNLNNPTISAPSLHPPCCAGTIAGGRDPTSALALYGQHLAPVPSANEQGLRMLIGLAYREALARRLRWDW